MTDALKSAAEALLKVISRAKISKATTSEAEFIIGQIRIALAAIEAEAARIPEEREAMSRWQSDEIRLLRHEAAAAAARIAELEAHAIEDAATIGRLNSGTELQAIMKINNDLVAERDELKARLDICHRDIDALMKSADKSEAAADALTTLLNRVTGERGKFKAALKPFADIVANKKPNGKTYTLVRVDACEAASTALSAEGG